MLIEPTGNSEKFESQMGFADSLDSIRSPQLKIYWFIFNTYKRVKPDRLRPELGGGNHRNLKGYF